jgi:hypothetical protein
MIPFSQYPNPIILSPMEKGRDIRYIQLNEVQLVGRNAFYPNPLLWNGQLISPYDEKVMSLNKDMFYESDYQPVIKECSSEHTDPVYFFIYNFDNYFHFIYDTLPYLIPYFKLKQTIPNLKLLVSYPNPSRNSFYQFNLEIFRELGILNALLDHKDGTRYKTMYVGNSLTHGGKSNDPPRKEVYDLFRCLNPSPFYNKRLPKKIYISRRTWIHQDKSNIGTDYTERRRMLNEDALVEALVKEGFTEIFCENLTMCQKIDLFHQAEVVVGAIGGGMCNLLFSRPNTKVVCIVSPYFLEINERFRFSMEHTNIQYIYDTRVESEPGKYPLYVRVKELSEGRIGEITKVDPNGYWVQLSNNDVAGFNNSIEFEKAFFAHDQLHPLDKGLNSPYWIDIMKVLSAVNRVKLNVFEKLKRNISYYFQGLLT